MANKNKPHSNDSQFFITLDKCQWLEKKHTIFGKVVGDTYYNVLNISALPTDKDDRPDFENPPKILNCEVIINPFPDIFPRKKIIEGGKEKNIRKPKNDNKLMNYENKNLLSFEELEDSNVNNGIKSSHEMLKNDPKLVNKPVINKQQFETLKTYYQEKEENLKSIKEKVKNITLPIKIEEKKRSPSPSSGSDSSRSASQENESKRTEFKHEEIEEKNNIICNDELFSENKKEINNLKLEILKIKKRKHDPEEETRLKEELKLYTPLQKNREKYLNKKKGRMGGRETLMKLQSFKEKLKVTELDADNWKSNKLKFHVDSQKAYSINEKATKQLQNTNLDAIEIIDPRKRQLKTNEIEKQDYMNMDKIFNVDNLINNTFSKQK